MFHHLASVSDSFADFKAEYHSDITGSPESSNSGY